MTQRTAWVAAISISGGTPWPQISAPSGHRGANRHPDGIASDSGKGGRRDVLLAEGWGAGRGRRCETRAMNRGVGDPELGR